MDTLVDMLVLTGFLSALFFVLGVIAGISEWAQQRFRLIVLSLRRQPPSPTHIRKLMTKNIGARKAATIARKSRGDRDVSRVAQSCGLHRKAA